MNIEIDFTEHIPIYIQLTDQIKHMIATGDLKPGDQLPTVRQMAADLRVNFNTVARAYRIMDEERIISTQHGRGTFILELASEEEMKEMRQQSLDRLTRYYLNEVHRLGYKPKEVKTNLDEKITIWSESGEPPSLDDEK